MIAADPRVHAAITVPMVDLPAQHRALRGELLDAIERVLDHGRFILGPEVEELERAWADLCGVRHAVSCSDGTSALTLVLRALDVGPGDEVVTAVNSFVASASCVRAAGAEVRFADVGPDYNIDPASIRRAVTPRTKAVIAVHLTGRPARMDEINAVAAARGLVVIEDAAQAAPARYRGRPVGSLGRAACFSLHPLKTIGACGDAGMITTDDGELAERLRRLRNHGIIHRQTDCAEWGYNARCDTLQAAILLVKLKYAKTWTERRRRHAETYTRRLGRLGDRVTAPAPAADEYAVYHTYVVLAERRDELKAFLAERGVASAVHYETPLHLVPAYHDLGHRRGDFPVAEHQADHMLSLPVHHDLTDEQVDYVGRCIEEFYS